MNDLERRDPAIGLRYREILERGEPTRDDESWIAVEVGPHVSAFVASIFQIDGARKILVEKTRELDVLMRVRKEFTKPRVVKKNWAARRSGRSRPRLRGRDGARRGARPGAVGRASRVRVRARGDGAARPRDRAPGAPERCERGSRPRAGGSREAAIERALAGVDPAFARGRGPRREARGDVSAALDRLARFGAFHRRRDPHGRIARNWVIFRTQEPMVYDDLVRVQRLRPGPPRADDRPGRPPAPPRRLRADRPADGAARDRGRDRDLHLLPRARPRHVREGHLREGRLGPEEPARHRARGLPARRAHQRGAPPAQPRRRARRARGDHDQQPDDARHGPPDLQRLHEVVHLPEAGAGQHSADRDEHPHGRARDAVGRRDLRPPHALEPAQRAAPVPAPAQRQEGADRRARARRLHARALPRERGLRRRRASTG